MPIFFQQDIDEHTKMGIWKIEEGEEFFLEKVVPQREVSHPHKNLQHLAGRYLLKYLFPDFPTELILIADTRKPFLEDEAYHFSISHCGDYAAAIVSRVNRVGVDIEFVSDKVGRIRHKFISDEEKVLFTKTALLNDHELKGVTLVWSSKEAVFKWFGLGKVDFKKHIEIKNITENSLNKYETIVLFKKNGDLYLDLHSILFDNLCLSFVMT
jgi:phosphopantetheinyl transferase